MTQQLPKNDSWKLTSTGTKIRDCVEKFYLLTILSSLPLESKINRKSKFLLFYCDFQLQSLQFQSCHVTTIFPHPYTLRTSINYRWCRHARAECLALWRDILHPRPGPRGGTAANTPLRILLPKGIQPVHRMGAIPIPIRRSTDHRLPRNREKRKRKTPTPTALLSPVQQQRPLWHSQHLLPLRLHTNIRPDAAVRIYARRHQLQQDFF